MPKRIDTSAIVLEDFEWADAQGRKWNVAGDVDVAKALRLLSKLQKTDESADYVEALADLADEVKSFFATRHSEEELKGLRIAAAHLIPLALGILSALSGDMQKSLLTVNPLLAQMPQ